MSRLMKPGPCSLLLLLLTTMTATAQTPVPAGDGLTGQYYDGENLQRVMLVRRDPTIDFNWTGIEPAPGLPLEHFSVRWQGWLLAPVSGRYRFYVSVDDGMRLWLNNHLLLNEWRNQPVKNYVVSIDLKAGQPYRLQVDYYQNGLDNRARLSWERPDQPRTIQAIPTRYLYTRKPDVAPPPAPIATRPTLAPPPPVVAARPAPRPVPRPTPRPVPVVVPPPTPQPEPTPVVLSAAAADSAGAARVARLSEGQAVTLPELYFEQGLARLLPAARVALDGLATALRAQPSLRLEVQGHTDNVGVAELNRQLSQQRAEAVCLYLTAHGVPSTQLRPVGYGGTRPVADNDDPEQRPKNRRVVLVRM
jgi:outer membrane protein OmpA-like peptidoglycan-associated protein